MILLLYGQPGTGKSTLATGIILDYLREGRRVVANFPVDPAPAVVRRGSRLMRSSVQVLPARPSFEQIKALGIGWEDPKLVGREDLAGLLVIDECGPWLDSRKWQDKDRAAVIDWLLHSRKRGWDIVLIAQAPGLVDKQVREAVVECYARCRRTDRLKVPVLGVKLPRFHVAIARYGLDQNAPRLQTWVYRGALEHKCFQSYALFDTADEIAGPYSTLPPRLTTYRGVKSWLDFYRIKHGAKGSAAQAKPAPEPAAPVQLRAKLPHVARAMSLPADVRIAALRYVEQLSRLRSVIPG